MRPGPFAYSIVTRQHPDAAWRLSQAAGRLAHPSFTPTAAAARWPMAARGARAGRRGQCGEEASRGGRRRPQEWRARPSTAVMHDLTSSTWEPYAEHFLRQHSRVEAVASAQARVCSCSCRTHCRMTERRKFRCWSLRSSRPCTSMPKPYLSTAAARRARVEGEECSW